MKRNGLLFQMVWLTLFLAHMDGARAAELYTFYNGIRGLAMGGAQIASVNDETAVLINPAALGKLRDSIVTIADPEIEGNLTSAQTMGETHGFGALTDPQELVDALQSHPDHPYHFAAKLFPSVVLPNFEIGVFGLERQDAELSSATSTIQYDFCRDVGVALGYNYRFWEGRIKIGVAARLFDRMYASTTMPSTTTGLTFDQFISDGGALALDGGIILSAPIRWLPSISAVVHDIGNTQFSLGGGGYFYPGTSAPPDVLQTVDVGASFFPIVSNGTRTTFAFEYRDVMTQDASEQSATYRRMHGGIEINFDDSFFLRAGWNQLYWTAGFEFSTRLFQFQVTSYGEDIGTPGSPQEDRRTMAKMAFRF